MPEGLGVPRGGQASAQEGGSPPVLIFCAITHVCRGREVPARASLVETADQKTQLAACNTLGSNYFLHAVLAP